MNCLLEKRLFCNDYSMKNNNCKIVIKKKGESEIKFKTHLFYENIEKLFFHFFFNHFVEFVNFRQNYNTGSSVFRSVCI